MLRLKWLLWPKVKREMKNCQSHPDTEKEPIVTGPGQSMVSVVPLDPRRDTIGVDHDPTTVNIILPETNTDIRIKNPGTQIGKEAEAKSIEKVRKNTVAVVAGIKRIKGITGGVAAVIERVETRNTNTGVGVEVEGQVQKKRGDQGAGVVRG